MKKINRKEKFSLIQVFGEEVIEDLIQKYPILQDESIQKFMEWRVKNFTEKGNNPQKFKPYLQHILQVMTDYCFYNDVTANPSDLLNEDNDDRNDRLDDYIEALKGGWTPPQEIKHSKNIKKKSEVSIYNTHVGIIRGYYKCHGLPITTYMKNVTGKNENEAILDRDDVVYLVKNATNPEYRLLIKFQCMLGLRISDVLNHMTSNNPQDTNKPLYKLEKHKNHFFIRDFITQKYKIKINFLFFPSELIEDIRKVYGYKEEMEDFDLRTLFDSKCKKEGEPQQKIKRQNLLKRFKALGDEEIEGNLKTHCFRKYFEGIVRNTSLDLPPKADTEFKTHLEGHHLDPVVYTYNQELRNLQAYYDLWLKIEPRLVIEHEIHFVEHTSETVVQLTKDKAKMENQMSAMMTMMEQQEEQLHQQQEFIEKTKNRDLQMSVILEQLLKNMPFKERQTFLAQMQGISKTEEKTE
jgi:hypothetical protein